MPTAHEILNDKTLPIEERLLMAVDVSATILHDTSHALNALGQTSVVSAMMGVVKDLRLVAEDARKAGIDAYR